MTRVLQIRRGTSAEHEKFVGMPGEITMDTDNKTIRLHDGETLGGTVIGGNSGQNTSGFDIATVPQEFWEETVARYTPAPFTVIETPPVSFRNNSSGLDYLIGGDDMPKFIHAVLVCKNDEAGYTSGDEVWCWGIGEHANPSPTPVSSAAGQRIRLMIDSGVFWVNQKVTCVKTNINDANWCILYRVYY